MLYSILYLNQTLDYETLHYLTGKVMGDGSLAKELNVSEHDIEHNVNHMIKLFIHIIEGRNVAALNEVKNIALHLIKSLNFD